MGYQWALSDATLTTVNHIVETLVRKHRNSGFRLAELVQGVFGCWPKENIMSHVNITDA
jgi:hypothetical protein